MVQLSYRAFAGLHTEAEIHLNESGQGFSPEDVGNVFATCGVGLGCEDDGLFAFGHDIADGELNGSADARVSLQQDEDFAILSLDVLFQLSSANGQIGEEAFDRDRGAFLSGSNRGSFQFARSLKIKSNSLRSFIRLSRHYVEVGEGAER